jgi:hypothetical protein
VAFHDTIAERYPALLFPTRWNRWLWRAKVRIALARARRVMTVSQSSARDVESILGVPADHIDVVSEAPDARFRPISDPAVTREVFKKGYSIPFEWRNAENIAILRRAYKARSSNSPAGTAVIRSPGGISQRARSDACRPNWDNRPAACSIWASACSRSGSGNRPSRSRRAYPATTAVGALNSCESTLNTGAHSMENLIIRPQMARILSSTC